MAMLLIMQQNTCCYGIIWYIVTPNLDILSCTENISNQTFDQKNKKLRNSIRKLKYMSVVII